ncbi:hypothetical protein [Caminibacter mediatlanticus]|nr:hypothetical protein [Caminibacter mediatlanticus]
MQLILVKRYGFKHIYVLKSVIKDWLNAGYSIVNKLGELKKAKVED